MSIIKIKKRKQKKKQNKPPVVMCTLINKPCIHADPRLADDGVYENCRLCDVYQSVVNPPHIKFWK